MEINGDSIIIQEKESTDIQDYLTSFNREIQDGAGPEEEKSLCKSDNLKTETAKPLTGVTFYSMPDGTLYSTTEDETSRPQLTFLSASNNPAGLQHILLAVGDVNSTDFTIPVQFSSQLLSSQNSIENTSPSDLLPEEEGKSDPGILECQIINPVSPEKADDVNSSMMLVDASQEGVSSQDERETGCVQTLVTSLNSEAQVEPDALQTITSIVQADDNHPVASGETFQTLTLVPSDNASGECNYVLVLSQPKDNEDNKDVDHVEMCDFPSDGKVLKTVEEGQGFKTVSMRVAQRPSQIITQHHSCNFCDYNSAKRYLLSRHLKSHSDDRPHQCITCGRGFKTLASLQNHKNTHTGTRPHSCKECDSSFTTSGELVRHIRYKHTHEKPHQCNECDYASVELSKLKRHMRCHTGERPYQCAHCTYASPDTYKLKRHMRIHTGEKPYTCTICSARFTQSNSLKAHLLIHSDTKPVFHCQFCQATCGRKTDLRTHMRKLHFSEMTYYCKDCNLTFKDQETFNDHGRTHDEDVDEPLWFDQENQTDAEESFPCDECGEAFTDRAGLKQHKSCYHNVGFKSTVEETAGKDNTCPKCDKTFATKGNLVRHLLTHGPNRRASLLDKTSDVENDHLNDPTLRNNTQLVVVKVLSLEGLRSPEPEVLTTEDGQTILMDGSQAYTVIQPVLNNAKMDAATQIDLPNMDVEVELQKEAEDDSSPVKKGKRKREKKPLLVKTCDKPKIVEVCSGVDLDELSIGKKSSPKPSLPRRVTRASKKKSN